jgi:hypothetical protein
MDLDLSHPPLVALDMMIEWTLKSQQKNVHLSKTLSKVAWLKEFCTIKFCLPRQSGHTTAIKYLATKYFKNPVIIVPNNHMLSLWDHNFKVCTFNNFETQIIGRSSIDCIIIDVASFMSKSAQEEIYNLFSRLYVENLIIMFIE